MRRGSDACLCGIKGEIQLGLPTAVVASIDMKLITVHAFPKTPLT